MTRPLDRTVPRHRQLRLLAAEILLDSGRMSRTAIARVLGLHDSTVTGLARPRVPKTTGPDSAEDSPPAGIPSAEMP